MKPFQKKQWSLRPIGPAYEWPFLSGILTSSLNRTSLDAARISCWLDVYTAAHMECWDHQRREGWWRNGHLSGSSETWRALSRNMGVLDDV